MSPAAAKVYNRPMDWIPVNDRLPSFGKNVLACSNLAVPYFIAYVSPVDKIGHLAFGNMEIRIFTHWVPLPELPQGSVLV